MSLKPVSFKKPVAPAPRLSKPYEPGKHDKRFWTEAELDIIREWYPKGGMNACLVRLPVHRSKSGVYVQAQKLGLSAPNGGGPKERVQPPEGFDDELRRFYENGDGKKRGEVNAFADRWGLPRWWVTKRATKLGLVMPHKKEPPWTAAEDALMAKAPLHHPDLAARMFRDHGYHRSPTAIVVRAKRLGLSRRATREEMSATKVAKLLGVDGKTVTRWILEWGLPASKRADKRLPQQGGSSWDVKPADLRQWIIDNLEHIDLRKVEKFEFVDLLVRGDAAAK